jgi:acetyl/propionyl-CoA carboxylase alpha subunit
VRVDTGVTSGDEITVHYDPMIAKIIAHAADRPAAIRRMQSALRQTVLRGIPSNLEFLQAVLAHPVFAAGEADTRFIEKHLADWQPALAEPVPADPLDRRTPWETLTGFRLGVPRAADPVKRGAPRRESRAPRAPRGDTASPGGVVRAPMPGQVRAVQSAAGQSVQKGDTLLILEAMKMEIRIQAAKDGIVASIAVSVGEQVEKEQVLAEIA